MKNKEKWLYMGLIPSQKVLRVAISDFTTRFKLLTEGWVFTTKEAYNTSVKFEGNVKVFVPTTYAGINIYSNVQYTPQQLKQIQNGVKNT
jgi:hypothetical protein